MDYVIGVDIGATKIHSALVSLNGKIIKEYKTLTEADKPRDFILSKIKHSIKELWTKEVVGIGIGIPGPFDKNGKSYPPNIPSLRGINLSKILKSYKVPIETENDSNCFVLGEFLFGTAKRHNNVIGLTLGTGVGGGIIIDNDIYHGRDGAAGEFGHITIDRDGYLCNCGNHGCLEMYVSGTAIEMRTHRHIKIKDIPTSLNEKDVSALKVHYAALKGDKLAKRIMNDTGKYLGIGLSDLINIFNPEIIVLGGTVAKAFGSMKKTFFKTIKERAMLPANKVRVVPTKLKHPGTLGAAAVIIHRLNKRNKDEGKKSFRLF